MKDWKEQGVSIYLLHKDGAKLPINMDGDVGFLLSDDIPFSESELNIFAKYDKISLGEIWLQGQSCITIIHHLIDSS